MVDCPRNHRMKWAKKGNDAKVKNSMASHDKGEHKDVEEVEEQDDEADEDDVVVFIIVIIIVLIIITTIR